MKNREVVARLLVSGFYQKSSMLQTTRIRNKNSSKIVIYIGIIITITFILFSVSEIRYKIEGLTLDASVEKIEAATLKPEKNLITSTVYIVSYDFQLPGEQTRRKGLGDISRHLFDRLRDRKIVEIQVIKSQPEMNRPIDRNTWETIFSIAFGLTGLGLIFFGVNQLSKFR